MSTCGETAETIQSRMQDGQARSQGLQQILAHGCMDCCGRTDIQPGSKTIDCPLAGELLSVVDQRRVALCPVPALFEEAATGGRIASGAEVRAARLHPSQPAASLRHLRGELAAADGAVSVRLLAGDQFVQSQIIRLWRDGFARPGYAGRVGDWPIYEVWLQSPFAGAPMQALAEMARCRIVAALPGAVVVASKVWGDLLMLTQEEVEAEWTLQRLK